MEDKEFTREELITAIKAFHLDSLKGVYSKELVEYVDVWISKHYPKDNIVSCHNGVPFCEYTDFIGWLESEGWYEAVNEEYANHNTPNSCARLSIEELYEMFKKKEVKLPVTDEECVPFMKEDTYFIASCGGICSTNYSKENKSTILSKEMAEAFLALMQLVKFRDIWNEGWQPDWSNNLKEQFIIYFRGGYVQSTKSCIESHPLVFKTEELADKFLHQFEDLIETAKPLL
jgi:hypothetical protein